MKSFKAILYQKSRKLRPDELPKVYKSLRGKFGHQHWWPGDTPFEVIIGAILTQNTAWVNVEKAILNLKQARQLEPLLLKRISQKKLAQLIRPAGYFNVKADRLKHFINFLFREYGGSLKKMFRERGAILRQKLLAVKGIGPETADSILLYAAQKPFFVIDAYTKRIFSRHRLYPFDADYHSWQKIFEQALPASKFLYNDYHAQIVMLGKKYCQASRARCETCPLKIYL